jgi:hypothetical protein
MICKGQRSFPEEIEFRDELLKEFRVPNQVINTDSVYSFLRSWRGNDDGLSMWSIEEEPISFDSLFMRVTDRLLFMGILRGYYKDDPYREQEIIPPAVFRKMLAKVFDPTTQCTEPIGKWNTARMGKQWITEGFYKTDSDVASDSINKKIGIHRDKINHVAKVHRIVSNHVYSISRHYTLSIPVFDDDYNYAFLINRDWYDHRDYSFMIFKREEGWKVVVNFDSYLTVFEYD